MATWKNIFKYMHEFSFLDDHGVEFTSIQVTYYKNTRDIHVQAYYRINGTMDCGKYEYKDIKKYSDYALFKKFQKQLSELSELKESRTCQYKDLGDTYSIVYTDWDSLNKIGRQTNITSFVHPSFRVFTTFRLNRPDEFAGFILNYNMSYTSGLVGSIPIPVYKITTDFPDEVLEGYFSFLEAYHNTYIKAKETYELYARDVTPEIKLLFETRSK